MAVLALGGLLLAMVRLHDSTGTLKQVGTAGHDGPTIVALEIWPASTVALTKKPGDFKTRPRRMLADDREDIEPVWVRPALPEPDNVAPYLVPGVLSLPAKWKAGDVAAVVVNEQPGPEPWRLLVTAQLLADGVAVLELDVHTARGVAADNAAAPPPPTSRELLPDLFGALRLLIDETIGAGSVIVLGRDTGGAAALIAADADLAAHHLGLDGPRFAGHIQLSYGNPLVVVKCEAVLNGCQTEARLIAASMVITRLQLSLSARQAQ